MNLDREFLVFYQPKPNLNYSKRRFIVSVSSLYKYIGRNNANTAVLRALKSGRDEYRVKLRKFGIIDFYVK